MHAGMKRVIMCLLPQLSEGRVWQDVGGGGLAIKIGGRFVLILGGRCEVGPTKQREVGLKNRWDCWELGDFFQKWLEIGPTNRWQMGVTTPAAPSLSVININGVAQLLGGRLVTGDQPSHFAKSQQYAELHYLRWFTVCCVSDDRWHYGKHVPGEKRCLC